jgi:hypothetical protein
MSASHHRAPHRRRAALGLAIGVAALGDWTTDVDAAERRPRPPSFTLNGTGTWQIRPSIGDVAVNGTGSISSPHGRRGRSVLIAAVLQTDDRTLPAPGDCEPADATATAYGARGVDLTLIGRGELCGTVSQPPTTIVSHVFTGTFEVYGNDTRPRHLEGVDGFYEVRLADNGTASVFAIDT